MNARVGMVLRLFAIAIAVAGAIDPSVTSMRSGKPRIAVVTADSAANAVAVDRVSAALRRRFTVVRAPMAGTAATVIVGDELPPTPTELASPVFAVLPSADGPTVQLETVHAQERSLVSARVPVGTTVRVMGSKGRHMAVTLSVNGLVIDRVERDIVSDDTVLSVPLMFVPTSPGAVTLHITATVPGGQRAATADAVADVRDTRWSVLFFDPRPSWMSTFVRRAVERDPRFVVTSRVVTSRGISTDAGQPPETLNDLTSLGLFDVIVVGAPEALTDGHVAGLNDFLRRRGGGVVLLMDQQQDGPYRRLTDVDRWETTSDSSLVVAPVAQDSGALRAGEIAWPTRLPGGASPVALSRMRVGGKAAIAEGTGHPVVWRSAIGAGQLVVSGALDAWRFRDDSLEAFDAFWRALVAESANTAVPPIEINVDTPVLAPGEETGITVRLRDVTLADPSTGAVRAEVGATIDGVRQPSQAGGGAAITTVRLWPDGPVGTFRGTVRAPDVAGVHRIVVSAAGLHADAPMVVSPTVARATPDDRDLVASWSLAHGGSVVPTAQLGDLPAALSRAVQPKPNRETWYPMRSGWWMVPFMLALGLEWWSRRRRGEP